MSDDTTLILVPEVEVDEKLARQNGKLRLDAGLVYMTHPTGTTIEELHKDPRFAVVTARTLERWSSDDKWVERRTEFLQAWAEQAKAKLGTELTKARLQEMSDLQEVRLIAMDKIRDEMTAPKSLEGMIKALVEVGKREESVAVGVANEMMPGNVRMGIAAGAVEHKLEEDERRALTKTILRMRRNQVRAESETIDVVPTETAVTGEDVEDTGEDDVEDVNADESTDSSCERDMQP